MRGMRGMRRVRGVRMLWSATNNRSGGGTGTHCRPRADRRPHNDDAGLIPKRTGWSIGWSPECAHKHDQARNDEGFRAVHYDRARPQAWIVIAALLQPP